MTPADKIRERIVGLMRDHGLDPDETDFKGDHGLASAVLELRWCLKLLIAASTRDEA